MSIADAAAVMAAASAAAASMHKRLSPKDRNMYHLRRIVTDLPITPEHEKRLFYLFKQMRNWTTPSTDAELVAAYAVAKDLLLEQSTMVLLDSHTRFGRNPEMVDVVLHSDTICSQNVSRLHTEIFGEFDPKDPTRYSKYYILDRSLNGTYVNNNRAPPETTKMYLKNGDIIRFGHSNGAAFKPGEYAQVIDSEFSFVFEHALDSVEYMGHTPIGDRVDRKGPQAYMHIPAMSVLAHEFDHFSLVPKKEPDLTIVPIGMRVNKEQRKADLIPAHTQLLMTSDRHLAEADSVTVPRTSNAAAVFDLTSGFGAPTVVPQMTNFDVTMDLTRLLREFQNMNGQTAEQANALFVQQLLGNQIVNQPNFHFYQQPSANPLLNQLNIMNTAMNQQRLNQFTNQSNQSYESILSALKQLAAPILNSNASIIPEFNQSVYNGVPNAQHAIDSLLHMGSQGGINQAFQQFHKRREDMLNAMRTSEASASSSTPVSTTSDHTDELVIAQKKAQAEAEARKNEAAIAALINGMAPTSSVHSLHPEDREMVISQANSVKSDESTVKKVAINEITLRACTAAAEAAAASSSRLKVSPQLKPPPVKKERVSRKKNPNAASGPSSRGDHILDTINAVAKRGLEGDTEEKEDAAEAEAIIREAMKMSSPPVVKPPPKPRKNNKKVVEENGHIEKTTAVLKLLDDAKSKILNTSAPSQERSPVAKEEPQEAGPSKVVESDSLSSVSNPVASTSAAVKPQTLKEPKPKPAPIISDAVPTVSIIVSKDPEDDRELTSSVDSLIVCEASLDDPALLNVASLNDMGGIFGDSRPDILSKSSGVKNRPSAAGKNKIIRKDSVSTSDTDSDFEEKKKNPSVRNLASERGRKKSTSSVKQRVYRVPRSPIPCKKGPERIPGHKSNEVARLLYDLEVLPISGSYMHCARRDKDKKKKGGESCGEFSEEFEEEEQQEPPAMLQKRKSIDGRTSESPAKKLKESEENNGHLPSPSDGASPKVNGTANKKRKAEKVDNKKKDKEKDKKEVSKGKPEKKKEPVSEASSDSEEEPSPKKKKPAAKAAAVKAEKKPRTPRKNDGNQKKRGRKAKNQLVELINGEWERCSFAGCKHPRIDGTVNWVQCDDCDRWFHIFCAFGRDDKCVLEDEFHCGCQHIKKTEKVAPAAGAVTA